MNNKTISDVSRLETKVDMLETELSYINKILVDFGFPEGVTTLKKTIEEVLEENAEKTTRHASQET